MDKTDISVLLYIFISHLFLLCFWIHNIFKMIKRKTFRQNGVLIIIDVECYKDLHKAMYGRALETDLFRWHHKKKYQMGIKEELLPIAWHPSRYWDWCMAEDEKKILENFFVQ